MFNKSLSIASLWPLVSLISGSAYVYELLRYSKKEADIRRLYRMSREDFEKLSSEEQAEIRLKKEFAETFANTLYL